MKVRYGNYRKDGVDMTGKVVEMNDYEAVVLIASSIVLPVGDDEIETTSLEMPENAMLKLKKRRQSIKPPKKKANGKRNISGKR